MPPAKALTAGYEMLGHVLSVAEDGQTAVINRGAAHGLTTRLRGLAMRPRHIEPGASSPQVNFEVQAAVADVISLTPLTATVRLRNIGQPVQVGDLIAINLQVPASLVRQPLFRVAALDIGLVRLQPDAEALANQQPLLDLAAIIAAGRDGSFESLRAQTLAAMVSEMHRWVDAAAGVHKKRIESGIFHKKTLGEALAATTTKEMEAFVDFMAAFPGKYITHEWKLINVYATWITSETPTGESLRLQWKTEPLFGAAKAAIAKGEFKDAALAYREVLGLDPGNRAATEAVAKLETLRRAAARTKRDPDDTAARYDRAMARYHLGLYDDARSDFTAVAAKGYKERSARTYVAYCFNQVGQYRKAQRIFRALLKEQDDKSLASWLAFSVALDRAKRSKRDAASAHLAIARIHEHDGAFDSALERYRRALNAARTEAQRAEARAGQARIDKLQNLAKAVDDIDDDITKHAIDALAKKLPSVLKGYKALERDDDLERVLKRFAATAATVSEFELGLAFHKVVAKYYPTADNLATAAEAFYFQGDYDGCYGLLDRADAANTATPPSSLPARVRSAALLGQGRYDDAAALATQHKSFQLQKMTLARVALAQGRDDQALTLARAVAEAEPNDTWYGLVYGGIVKAVRATQALRSAQATGETGAKMAGREGLRRVRGLVMARMPWAALEATEALSPWPESYREAHWSIAAGGWRWFSAHMRLRSAILSAPATPSRKRLLAVLTAEAPFEDDQTPQTATAYAKALVDAAQWQRAVAVLKRHANGTADLAGRDLLANAKRGLYASALLEHGQSAILRNDFEAGERLVAESLATLREIGVFEGQSNAVYWLSSALSQAGKRDAARALIAEYLPAARRDGDPFALLDLRQMQGRLEAAEGSSASYNAVIEESLKICAALDNDHCTAVSHLQLAQQDNELGLYGSMLAHALAAETLWRRQGNRASARDAMGERATAHRNRNEVDAAAKIGMAMLAESREDSDSNSENLALMHLGAAAIFQGKEADAVAFFDTAYALGERTGNATNRGVATYYLGKIAMTLTKNAAKAIGQFSRAAVIFEALGDDERLADTMVSLGEARLMAKDPRRATRDFEMARALSTKLERRLLQGKALSGLAQAAIARGRPEDAEPLARSAVALAEATESRELKWRAYHALGRALRDRAGDGDKRAAADALLNASKIAVEAMESAGSEASQRGMLEYGDTREILQDTIALLVELGRGGEALELLELTRDAKLRKTFDPSRVKTQNADLRGKLDALTEAKRRSAAATKALEAEQAKPKAARSDKRVRALAKVAADSDATMGTLLLTLKSRYRGLYNAMAVNPRSMAERRSALPAGAVLVEYFLSDDAIYIFVIAKDRPEAQTFQVPVSAERVAATVALFRKQMTGDPRMLAPTARQLYTWLIAPIDDLLTSTDTDTDKTVLLVPFGPLHYIPFGALVASPKGAPPVYAVERFRFATVSSLTLERLLKDRIISSAELGLLAFAANKKDLPGAVEEVNRIKIGAFPKAALLTARAATKAAFFEVAKTHRILHFATHGVLKADPMASYLMMAGEHLTVEEISGYAALRGKTDIVVLSACQTAMELGQSSGDEAISIAEGFAAAGVPTLVASLWDVDDKATAQLMERFYKGLSGGNVSQGDTLDSLRQAQLALLRHKIGGKRPWASPQYWAGFQLIGDYR